MTLIEAIILGMVQGLTEFLPVSSSGHLEIAKAITGNTNLGADSLAFTVVLHAATALSTLVVYRNEVIDILQGIFSPDTADHRKFSLWIIVSMIPAAAIGVSLNDQIELLFENNILLVGSMLLVTAVLLYAADRFPHGKYPMNTWRAFVVGLAQAIAILPGISRSGATISTSVLLGIDREKAARFSFLMVVPLILGKMAKDLLDGADFKSLSLTVISAGFVAAFITGLFACRWMIRIVKNSKLVWFAAYCLVVGLVAITWALTNG